MLAEAVFSSGQRFRLSACHEKAGAADLGGIASLSGGGAKSPKRLRSGRSRLVRARNRTNGAPALARIRNVAR
jgi:hypothetical protein